MDTNRIVTNLEYRIIDREGDKDYFIETDMYTVNMELNIKDMSRVNGKIKRRDFGKQYWRILYI